MIYTSVLVPGIGHVQRKLCLNLVTYKRNNGWLRFVSTRGFIFNWFRSNLEYECVFTFILQIITPLVHKLASFQITWANKCHAHWNESHDNPPYCQFETLSWFPTAKREVDDVAWCGSPPVRNCGRSQWLAWDSFRKHERLSSQARSQNCKRRLLASPCLSVRPFVRPHRTTRIPMDGFSWNFIFGCFSKNCWEY